MLALAFSWRQCCASVQPHRENRQTLETLWMTCYLCYLWASCTLLRTTKLKHSAASLMWRFDAFLCFITSQTEFPLSLEISWTKQAIYIHLVIHVFHYNLWFYRTNCWSRERKWLKIITYCFWIYQDDVQAENVFGPFNSNQTICFWADKQSIFIISYKLSAAAAGHIKLSQHISTQTLIILAWLDAPGRSGCIKTSFG